MYKSYKKSVACSPKATSFVEATFLLLNGTTNTFRVREQP